MYARGVHNKREGVLLTIVLCNVQLLYEVVHDIIQTVVVTVYLLSVPQVALNSICHMLERVYIVAWWWFTGLLTVLQRC